MMQRMSKKNESSNGMDRRRVLKTVGAAMAAGTASVGTAAAHRPDPLDWYQHWIVGCTGDYVVIEDELPGGNTFVVRQDTALDHIVNDHGWSELTITKFVAEIEKLCAGLEPDWDVLEWYTHRIVDCREGSDQRYITVKDGLGYTFEIGYDFFTHHIANHHGWSQEDQDEFFAAVDHFCGHQTS